MINVRYLVICIGWGIGGLIVNAQDNSISIPPIWTEIEHEAEIIASVDAQTSDIEMTMAWSAAARIAQRHARSGIDTLFNSAAEIEKISPNSKRFWARQLSAYVMVETADHENRCGLKSILVGLRPGESPVQWSAIAIAAMDCYHDDASRERLLNIALSGDTSEVGFDVFMIPGRSYFALQMLRTYEPTQEMRGKIEQAVRNAPPSVRCSLLGTMHPAWTR
jgi:hypothetical protein